MTKRYGLTLMTIAGLLFVAACKNDQTNSVANTNPNTNRATPQSTAPDEFAAVKTIYGKDCKECHGQNGEGGPVKLADGSKLKVPSLREGHALRHNDAEFVKQINKGGDGMPAFADKLKPEEVNDLIKFIRREFQAGATPPK